MSIEESITAALEDESGRSAYELATNWITAIIAGDDSCLFQLGQLFDALVEASENEELSDLPDLADFCQKHLNGLDYFGEASSDACADSDLLQVLGDFALATDDPNLEVVVASNPHTPVPLLRLLAVSENGWEEQETAECVARNRSTPPDVLSQLAESGTGSAKFTVAQNPNCPPDVLVKLIDDNSYSDIRAFTRRYRCDPSTPEEAMDSVWVSVAAAGNPGTPADCLSAKLRNTVQGLVVPSPGSRIREVDEETLRAWQTTAALMCNPSTQTEAIAGCSTITSEVLQTVRELPSSADGVHLIGYLLEVASSTGLPLELLDEFTTHPDDRIRSKALANSAVAQD